MVLNDIFAPLVDLLGTIIKAPEERAKVASTIAKIQSDLDLELAKASKEIILAEAQGNSFQRNWRPLAMYEVEIILGMNYIIFPLLRALGVGIEPIELPESLWTLMILGMGGYMMLRSVDKNLPQYLFSRKEASTNGRSK